MHSIKTTQWDMETEGKGQAWIMLGRSFTESLHRRSSRTDLQAVSSVEDVQVTLPQPLFPMNCETQADYKEDGGHPKTRGRACRSASWRGREAICNWWFLTPRYVFLTPPTGQVDWRWPPALGVGSLWVALWLWEGTVRTGHMPNTLPSCRWHGGERVCGDGRIWGHALPRLPSSCRAHLFLPQLSKYLESTLSSNRASPSPAPLWSNHKSLNILYPVCIPQQQLHL
jgi:hypothetical protein